MHSNQFKFDLSQIMLMVIFVIQFTISISFEHCEETPSNQYGIKNLEIPSCLRKNECLLKVGKKFTIQSLWFSPQSNTTTLELQILVAFLKDNVEYQFSDLNSDLCDANNTFGRLESNYHSNENGSYCDLLQVSNIYRIPKYEFLIPELMPIKNVNITLMLIGDEGVVSCALFPAEFVNHN